MDRFRTFIVAEYVSDNMGNNGVDGTTVRTPVFPNGPSLCFLWTADHDLEAGMRPDPLTTRPQNGPSTTDQI